VFAAVRRRGNDPPRTRLHATIEPVMRAGSTIVVDVELENLGPGRLRATGRHPDRVGSRWFKSSGDFLAEGPRLWIRPSLRRGHRRRVPLRVTVPNVPGEYELRLTPVREYVAWLDDLHESNGLRHHVTVVSSPETDQIENELPGIGAMLKEMTQAPAVYQPSAFWTELSDLHRGLIATAGYDQFKRTVNAYYFQWLGLDIRHQLRNVLRQWLRRPNPWVFTARIAGSFSVAGADDVPDERPLAQRAYAWWVASLWEYASRRDQHGLIDKLEEPLGGSPLTVVYRRRAISQDICNSVLELTAILDAAGSQLSERPRVLEIGAGYGRVAWALLRARPGVRYVIADIPPALAIAQRYLSEELPDRRIFAFRHFTNDEEVAQELEDAEIAFLTPNQLDLVPNLRADLGISISSLHEMRRDQINHYLTILDRHCDGWVYIKQWQRWTNWLDDLTVSREDYPFPSHWRSLFDRPHAIQGDFFEALFATRQNPGR
jgi:putative sugar O-methyltransferase